MSIKKVAKNTVSNYVFTLFTMGLGLVSTPVVVNSVGEESFGLLLLASTIMGYFGLLNMGIPGAVVKYVAEFTGRNEHEDAGSVINTSFTLFLMIGIGVAGCVFLFVYLGGLAFFQISVENQQSARNLLYIAGGWAVISWPSGTFRMALKGLQEYHKLNIINGFSRILNISGTISTALLGFGIEVIFIAGNLGLLTGWFFQYRYLKRQLPAWNFSLKGFQKKTLKTIIGLSVWFLIIKVSQMLYTKADVIILGAYLPVSMITIYYVVMKPISLIQTFNGTFNSAMMPAISERFAREGRTALDGIVYQASKYNNALLAVLSIMGIYFSKPFIQLWMGEQYVQYAWIAQMTCAFQLIAVSNAMISRVFEGTGKLKTISIIAFLSAILNVILSVILAPIMGVVGVILATMIATSLVVPFHYTISFRELRIDRGRYFREGVLRGQYPSILVGIVLLFSWNAIQEISSWLGLALSALGFIIVLSITNLFTILDKKDRDRIFDKVLIYCRAR